MKLSIFGETPYQEAYRNYARQIYEEIKKLDPERANLYSDIPNITHKIATEYRQSMNIEANPEEIHEYQNPTIWEFNSPNYTVSYFIDKGEKHDAVNTYYYELIREHARAILY